MTRLGIVTQARTTSTRLPGKVLIEVGGKTLLEHHLDRLEESGLPVYVATTVNATDDPIVDLAARREIDVHRGSEDDVLARFAGLAEQEALDVLVRVTSDCPLIDGQVVRRGVEEWLRAGDPWLYVSNGLERSFPRGMDFEVFSAEALFDAAAHATAAAHREHVTPYLYSNGSGRVTLRNVAHEPDASSFRVTLDTPEDLEVIRSLIEDHGAADLDVDQIIEVLRSHPELAALNAHVEQKKLGE